MGTQRAFLGDDAREAFEVGLCEGAGVVVGEVLLAPAAVSALIVIVRPSSSRQDFCCSRCA